jgi:hypothetical protein
MLEHILIVGTPILLLVALIATFLLPWWWTLSIPVILVVAFSLLAVDNARHPARRRD